MKKSKNKKLAQEITTDMLNGTITSTISNKRLEELNSIKYNEVLQAVCKVEPKKISGIKVGSNYYEWVKTKPNNQNNFVSDLYGVPVYMDESLEPNEFKLIPIITILEGK